MNSIALNILKKTKALTVLNLASTQITYKGVTSICKALKDNISLIALYLQSVPGGLRNIIGHKGAYEIGKILNNNSNVLQILDVSDT